jgi:hypothetical protein
MQPLPAGLDEVTPGPGLAALLAATDPSKLSGSDCVELLRAQYRQVNHERARLLSIIAEVTRRDDPDGLARLTATPEFACDEVRAALVWSRRHAQYQCELALDLVDRLPDVLAALSSGVIDEPKTRIFAEWTLQLSDRQARALCTDLLPRAPGWTTGQLIERIKRWAIAVDPGWAQRRYQQAITRRRVVGQRNPDGSADLYGLNLPVDQVTTACARIDALAKAAKRAGRMDPIDHLRAELFLGMTDGSYAGLHDDAILATLTAGLDRGGSAEEPSTQSRPAPVRQVGRGVDIRVRLSTLLGLDRHPGELAGWGPVHAELARRLAETTRGPWRYVLTDHDGRPQRTGLLRRRPTSNAPITSAGTVEIQVTPALLRSLAETRHDCGLWTPVVTELLTSAGDHIPATDPTRRAPGAALRRLVQVRDRTCLFPGCRAPATTTDTDHSIDHARGGPTTEDNLGSLCRRDHRLKHHGRWLLNHTHSGHFTWTSRLGQTYLVRPPPVIEQLPEPIPEPGSDEPVTPPSDVDWQASTMLEPLPESPVAPPCPPADVGDETPPF